MTVKKPTRWVFVSDNHGNKHDAKAVAALWHFLKWWKPGIRIHGGDCFNFAALRKKASEQEKRERLQEDVDEGIRFLKGLEPTHFLRGNHDERLWDAGNSDDGKLADFACHLILDITDALGDKCLMYPYDKRAGVMRMGHLHLLHGYHSGIYAARLAAQVYGNVCMGHTHNIDAISIPGLERRVGHSVGCLCQLSQDYNRAQANTLRQSHGFAYGLTFPNGEFLFFQAQTINGTWYFPSEFREYRAQGN
jgi:predicted phosphodiesterase